MLVRRYFGNLLVSLLAVAPVLVSSATSLAARAKVKRPPVVGVVTEGIAESLRERSKGKKAKTKTADVGKTFTALCDGTVNSWKVTDVGDDGGLVGTFVGGAHPHRCLLLDASVASPANAKTRPAASASQIAAAKAAATGALTSKSGELGKIEVVVFHDGDKFVAVGQSTRASTSDKGNCLDHTSLVILHENESAGVSTWKPVFRPSDKGKGVCGYSYFTRADVDGDGRDEIALRLDRGDGYKYRVLKRNKGTYSVAVR